MTMLQLLTCERAKAYFKAHRVRFTKARATRETAKQFNATPNAVKQAAYYW